MSVYSFSFILITKIERHHDQDRYKKKRDIPVPMNFGVDLVDNKNWFYKLSSKGQ
ncbi:hypothetical protein RDI58_016164 [Solanum bulbocastanum]|uniref:Uncharacterized protein n=1 Tax=Solanum bulbocastanum TaxID=147425 RepID=A0AAN8TJ74_SOLBU